MEAGGPGWRKKPPEGEELRCRNALKFWDAAVFAGGYRRRMQRNEAKDIQGVIDSQKGGFSVEAVGWDFFGFYSGMLAEGETVRPG